MREEAKSSKGQQYDVCIVGMKCYDYLSGTQSPRYLGGIEKDLVTLARIFADSGRSVAMLTFDQGQPKRETMEGVEVYACYRPDAGLPVLRFLYPRAYRVLANILRINAPITIVMGVGAPVAWAALASRLHRRLKFVFLTASDSDCERSLPLVKTGHEKILYRYGLARADACFTQNTYQRMALARNFARDSQLLRIPAYASSMARACGGSRTQGNTDASARPLQVTWIGRLSAEKRPEWILDIARRCPDVHFNVAGGSNERSPESQVLLAQLRGSPNITYLGKLPPAEMDRIYADSDFIMNTSAKEGFPAIFREAWHYGVPVISVVDPDSLIADNQAGFVASGIEHFVQFLGSGDAKQVQGELSRNAIAMYKRQFSEKRCLDTILASVSSEQSG